VLSYLHCFSDRRSVYIFRHGPDVRTTVNESIGSTSLRMDDDLPEYHQHMKCQIDVITDHLSGVHLGYNHLHRTTIVKTFHINKEKSTSKLYLNL
jgi:hypothetical protein